MFGNDNLMLIQNAKGKKCITIVMMKLWEYIRILNTSKSIASLDFDVIGYKI